MNYGKAKTILNENKGFQKDFAAARCVECYDTAENFRYSGSRFHTDALGEYCEWADLIQTERVIVDWELMNEDDYNNSIEANSSGKFSDYYDKGDKVLVVLYGEAEEE